MAYSSYRDFVETLERHGELKRISSPVATELEITELADREMKSPGGGKALLIEKPTINGVVSPFPVAINTMGSWKRMALAIGAESVEAVAEELGMLMKAKPPTSIKEALKLFSTAIELRHAKPRKVKTGPCKEIIHRFDAPASHTGEWPAAPDVADLSTINTQPPTLLDIPILRCWPLDGGRFVTLPCVVTRDPDTGERNLGMYRVQVYDGQTTGMHWQLQKVAARHGRRYYETGQRMPVTIFLGGDPAFPFAATAPLPDGLDEFLLAGYLRRKSIDLVKCETNDLEVPADADFVIEGYIDPTEPLRMEGPFGDHTGYYTLPEPYPVFHVTAITHRKDAVYPATIVGIPPMEDFYMGAASVKLFMPIFKMNFPEIVDIALPAEGVFHNAVFVSIKKTYPMQAYKVMHGLWGMGQMMFTKYLVVVDHDVDVHNTSEVLFHLCANTDPQRDSMLTRGPADVLDHATSEIGIGGKMGIDATRKMAGEGFKRGWPPLIKMDPAVKAAVDRLKG
ncbi:4-hydroxy-3-polyprenylbenzoate decarboxylase [Terrimicrobium sacchariphilum]|uniref:4-hydroxy-3-polyprenylbenzoate decarboxylase n=1 Tax=Terrimicrobium sacchariphilum TaxID=690879 RepID=A0A146G7I8_TERSA|nr:UbiD family decarboxylase [Terrimicrobium sacchariphilum]GAT33471.1 4-hydroxy-3-polyprenylbenzoate decarboxylase [Terrimicrobium sacchariphilum]